MKRVLVPLILALSLSAGELEALRLKIIDRLARLLVPRPFPAVYIDPALGLGESAPPSIRLVKKCEDADILFVHDIDAIQKECPLRSDQKIFTLSYRDYLDHTDEALGAFFWQKGRPNIVLNAQLLKIYHLEIPPGYAKYVE